jgi:pentatricopeptide repeat protein
VCWVKPFDKKLIFELLNRLQSQNVKPLHLTHLRVAEVLIKTGDTVSEAKWKNAMLPFFDKSSVGQIPTNTPAIRHEELDALIKTGEYVPATKIYHELLRMGSTIDVLHFRALVRKAPAESVAKLANPYLEMVRRLPSPHQRKITLRTAHTDIILRYAYLANHELHAKAVLEIWTDLHMVPFEDYARVWALIKVFAKKADGYELMVSLFKMAITKTSPPMEVIESVCARSLEQKDSETLTRVNGWMNNKAIKPTEKIMETMIQHLANGGKKEALSLFESYMDIITPSTAQIGPFNSVMEFQLKLNDGEAAVTVFKVVEQLKIRPSGETYVTLSKALASLGRVSDAIKLMNDMRTDGVAIPASHYAALGALIPGNDDRAKKLQELADDMAAHGVTAEADKES